jgi:hypothetical protein
MGPPQPPGRPQQHNTSTQQDHQQPRQPSSSLLAAQPPGTASRKTSAQHLPGTPLASVGPPNFSYGSSTLALPRQISLADTNMSIFAAMKKSAAEARERDIRAGKVVEPEPEGQDPLVRFYEETLEEIPAGEPIKPPPIRAIRDEPVSRASPRRSGRNTSKSVEADEDSIEFYRRTPTPTPSQGMCP